MATRPLPDNDYDDDVEEGSDDLRDVHERAMQRFDSVAMPQIELRAQSLEARRFVTIPGAMWEGQWGELFENAPRPEVDKITKGLEKIETDYRENRLTVDYIPAGSTSDDDTAETLDGMHRADDYHFHSQDARDNAFQEGIRGGFGAWRLTTDYTDPYDPDDDSQRVNPAALIVDADQCVYFDPSDKSYAKRDAKWGFIVSADPRAAFVEQWGEDSCDDWPLVKWRWQWDWYQLDVVRSAEYFEVEETNDTLLIMTQPESESEQRFFKSEVDAGQITDLIAQGWRRKTRPIKRKRVHKYVMNGSKVLKDCGYIAFSSVPIVPFYFRRDFVDNMERWRGYVGKKMDSQRIYNTRIGKLTETDSLAPREIPIFAPQQMPPAIAEMWRTQNVERHPYALVEPLLQPDGNSYASLGPIGKVDPPQVAPVTALLLQAASNDLTEEDQNVEEVKANTSADAMDVAAARVDAKSGIPLDNMRQSVQREGELYLDGARTVYYEPGRKVETLDQDEKDGEATLVEPYMDQNQIFKVRNDLTQGKYKVVASVTESTATARQKTVRMCIAAAEMATQAGDAELAQWFMLTAALNMSGEGLTDLEAAVRKKAVGVGLTKPTPEEAKALQEASQGQQPSPADQALAAQTAKLASEAQLNAAKVQQTSADAALKTAQAEELSKAPAVPTGLSTPPENPIVQAADVASKLGSAKLNSAKADHLQHTMAMDHHEAGIQRIQTGAALAKQEHDQRMAEQTHELAKKQAERPAA